MFAKVLLIVAVAWLLLLFGVLVPLRTCAWPGRWMPGLGGLEVASM